MPETLNPRGRGGRPPKSERVRPVPDGASLLSARISAETRKLLELEAANSGRSISQQADLWLRQAAIQHSDLHGRVGASSAAVTLPILAAVARRVGEVAGDASQDWRARVTLIAAWRKAIARAVPEAPTGREQQARVTAGRDVSAACSEVVRRLRELPPDDPVRRSQALRPVKGSVAELGLEPDDRAGVVLAKVTQVHDLEGADTIGLAAAELSRAGDSLAPELERLTDAVTRFKAAAAAEQEQFVLAEAKGREIALATLPALPPGMERIFDAFSPT